MADDTDSKAGSQGTGGSTTSNSPTPVLSYAYGNFTGGADGAYPNADVLVDGIGDVFGTANLGGTGNIGTIYEQTGNVDSPPNDPVPLTSFGNYLGVPAGSSVLPGNLVMDSAGNLFGTTQAGGTTKRAAGTVFELAKSSTGYQATPTVLVSFKRAYAHGPENLTTDSKGDLIGTTTGRGASGNGGTVFELAKTATGFRARQTVLASFGGREHISSNLVTDASGNLIGGVTGGKAGTGEIFELKLNANGTFRKTPIILSGLGVQNLATDGAGNIFAVSSTGGAYQQGAVYQLGAKGSASVLTSFSGPNGSNPTGITLDSAGNIFGTTASGGASGYGTLFEIAKTATGYGQATTLESFTGVDGAFPGSSPVGSPTVNNGFVYGTTHTGGLKDVGEFYIVNPADHGGTTPPASAAAPAVVSRLAAAAAPAPCFAGGTRIRTSTGDVAVEALAIGDLVITASGAQRAIEWLGHRTIDCRRHPRPADVRPVRIAAHSFGPARPARDLIVSPGHAICVDVGGEVLIPAVALVDGASVVQLDVEQVTYWHVELESHDILLAENLATESYLEMGNRGFFAAGDVVALVATPDAPVPTHADFCRPFHGGGPVVEAVRAGLAERRQRMRRVAERRAS